jgi:hypothetical protein
LLDWKRLDMSIEPLLAPSIPESLREITIYAGSWTTLHYWLSRDVRNTLQGRFKKVSWRQKNQIIVAFTDGSPASESEDYGLSSKYLKGLIA